MEQSAFDVFQSVKNLIYLGDYQKACEEISSTDINEEDLSQIVKKYFYYFISCVEGEKMDDLNTFLVTLKNSTDEKIKSYFKLFLLFMLYCCKNKFDQDKLTALYNDLKERKKYDPILFPAVYIISLMLLDRKEYQNFLQVIDKFDCDIEILGLKFYLFHLLNKHEEMEKVLNTMNIKEPELVLSQLCTMIFNLYSKNDWEQVVNALQLINKNQKISPKMFNLIGISLMSKGGFEEASKIFNLGKEAFEKIGNPTKDYNSLLVNLICCYRNLNKETEIKNIEENLRKNDPNNLYFARLNWFEDEFSKATA